MSDLPVDLVWRVRGDCIYSGHGWVLFAALKQLATEAVSSPEVMIGPVTGTRYLGRGLLSIHRESALRLRCPPSRIGDLLCLDGQPLRVGAHIIQLTDPVVEPLRPSRTLHAEIVTFSFCKPGLDRSCPPPREKPGPGWWRNIRHKLAALDYHGPVTPGRYRKLALKGRMYQMGYAVEIPGLSDEVSLKLQANALGGRRHMGAGMLCPGPLPKHFREPLKPRRRRSSKKRSSKTSAAPARPRRRVYTPSAGGAGRCASITGGCGGVE